MWISPLMCAWECFGSSTYISLNCLAPSLPYFSMVPIAVSPSMLAFSRLMSQSDADMKVRSSYIFIRVEFISRALVRSARYSM